MKCPTCNEIDLLMSERQGIEIDYCPKCRGVWLDRGELDKFIQKSERQFPSTSIAGQPAEPRYEQFSNDNLPQREPRREAQMDQHRREESYDERGYPQRVKKKESFWGELFDFG